MSQCWLAIRFDSFKASSDSKVWVTLSFDYLEVWSASKNGKPKQSFVHK